MRATAVVALLLHALPGAYGVAATTFVRVPEDLAYAEAEARCTQIGAAIASIHSVAENELARIACGNTCWLGLAETGGDAGTAAANQTWLWQDPLSPAAYTNWAAGEPENAGGVDQRNAIIDTAGEWHDCGDGSLGLGYVAYPLCRVAGELDFTLDHAPQQCQVNTCIKGKTGNVPRKDRDPTCCGRGAETENIKHRSCAPVRNQTYQLVQTGENCDVGESVEAYKKYKCYPCKPGKTCDMGPGDEERCKWPGPGHGTFVGIFLVFLGPIIFCIFAGVGWYVHKRKNADETYAAAARRVLCRRGTKVRAVAPAASEVSVVDAPAARIAPTELGTVVAVEQPPDELRHLSEE